MPPASPTLTQSLRQWRSRSVFPTEFGSADMRGLSRQLRERSVFSARCTNAEFLEELARVTDDVVAGKIDMASGRWELMKKLKVLGYDPEKGFPQDMAKVPPAERGSLRDLSSEPRLKLMLETNVRMSANYGTMVDGNTEYARYAFPAWELVRVYERTIPRGSAESHSDGWELRWAAAGNSVSWEGAIESPLVALKDSPIWQALGDGAVGYEDSLNNPYPPFAFGSGKGWKPVPRMRCAELGLITGNEVPGKMDGKLSAGMQEVHDVLSGMPADFIDELQKELAA